MKDALHRLFDSLKEALNQLAGRDLPVKAALEADMQHMKRVMDLFDAAAKSTAAKREENLTKQGETLRAQAETGEIGDRSAESGKRYSIRNIIGESGKDYGIGVYLDSPLLENLTENEQKEILKEYVTTDLAGKSFIGYDNLGNPVEISIAKKTDKIKTVNGNKAKVLDDLYKKYNGKAVRRESVALADELIQAAKYSKSEPAEYSHDWLDNNGSNHWDYWTVYIQQKNKTVWQATLNIANTANGEKLLYTIDPIEKVEGAVTSATNSVNNTTTPPPEVKGKIPARGSPSLRRGVHGRGGARGR